MIPRGSFFWADHEGPGKSANQLKYRKAPHDFKMITDTPVAIAWQLFCCGEPAKNIPPYRCLEQQDVPYSQRKKLCDFQKLFKPIVSEMKASNAWKEQFTVEEANEAFRLYDSALQIERKTPSNRTRRVSHDMNFEIEHKIYI